MKYKLLHICNQNIPNILGFTNIHSFNELDKQINDDLNIVFLIQINLSWNNNSLSNDYGFDVANLLRVEYKYKYPIVFYSPLKVAYYEELSKQNIKYKILFAPATSFIESPFSEEDIFKESNNLKNLSNATLHDVVTMLCNVKGLIIDKISHDLKFNNQINDVFESTAKYLTKEQKALIDYNTYNSKLIDAYDNSEKNKFELLKLNLITTCNQKLTSSDSDKESRISKKYKVLYVDDLQSDLDLAIEFLDKRFELITTTSGQEAIDILKKDNATNIIAVITDWRLYNTKSKNYWQENQGYEVLKYSAQNSIRSLIALTAQANFLVHQLRNIINIRFSLFKKENLRTKEQWGLFSDVLSIKCEEAVNSRASILDIFPTWNKKWGKGENKTLKQQYIEFWHSDNKEIISAKLESTIEDMWKYLNSNENPYLFRNVRFEEYRISIKVLELNKILILRRLWFGLWYSSIQTNKDLIKKEVYEIIFGEIGTGSIAQRTSNLCIHLNKINPDYMFPEEIDWLIKKKLLKLKYNLG